MGRVFQPYYTKKIPHNARVVEHNGIPGVWVGSRNGPTFARLLPDMKRIRVTVGDWYIEFRDATGRDRREKVGPDRAEAEALLATAESRVRLQRSSLAAMKVGRSGLAASTPRPVPTKSLDGVEGMLDLDLTLFPFIPAVYFLSHQGKVVYVGQSVNFLRRVVKHMEDKVFDAVSYLPTPPEQLESVEAEYVRKLRPKYNLDDAGKIRLGWRKAKRLAAKGAATRQGTASESDTLSQVVVSAAFDSNLR